MNRRSSYCLRVSISTNPQVDKRHVILTPCSKARSGPKSENRGHSKFTKQSRKTPKSHVPKREAQGGDIPHLRPAALETNHEHTLYVPYVFCNHLISRQRSRGFPVHGPQGGSAGQPYDLASGPGGCFIGKWRTD